MTAKRTSKAADYQKKLKANLADYVRNCPRTKEATEHELQDEIEGLYNLVRDIALESYKNGLSAGARRGGTA